MPAMMQTNPASYRDPDGFVFRHGDKVYRFISRRYEPVYRQLMDSGLYEQLVAAGMLIAHQDAGISPDKEWQGRVIEPRQLSFISYPYEWSFDMWKDAALLTLDIALLALDKGMTLKDATPFNVQFEQGRPLFIDTLSLALYDPAKPWAAYRQFCECLLGPLLLQHYGHPDANRIFTVYPNGIPLSVLVKMLPARSRWSMNVNLHIYLQEKIARDSFTRTRPKAVSFSRQKFENILKGLKGFVKKLGAPASKTTWQDYYTTGILGPAYLEAKTAMVREWTKSLPVKTVIDLGANDGHFSRLFSDKQVVALDADGNCINQLYAQVKKEKLPILPLHIDLLAPSPAIGWNNRERESITERLRADLALALALVHHLAISANLPLPLIATWLQPVSTYLLIEFVPKDDERLQFLLHNREDIFDAYTLENFRAAFGSYYETLQEATIPHSQRVLFLLKRK